ncbi:MAG: hypothetical protein ACLFU6_09455 [Candidatus Hydrogenedentota bacterium]
MKPMATRALFIGFLAAGLFVSNLAADDDPYFRHGLDIPVEGTERPVGVSDVAWPENFRPTDTEGWSTFSATPDTRILYVSSSEGNDETAVIHEPGDDAVGPDPFSPEGAVKPFAEIDTALKQQRPEMPDWILLKRGDTWRGPITEQQLPPGKSGDEPRLIGAYGPLTEPRPQITGRGTGFRLGGPHNGTQHVAIVGIEFYNSWKDPEHPDWDVDVDRLHGPEGEQYEQELQGPHSSGLAWANADRRGPPMENVLIEDCYLRFCPISGTNFGADMKNFVVRRNVVVDHYPLRGHTMGFWNSGGSLRLEENIVDHCGWYHQRGQEPRIGWANPLSHNLYYSKCWNTALVRNLWLRSASIGNKFRADDLRSLGNLLVDDNLFVDGELGPAISGNYPGPYRNVNVNLVNNVLSDIGRSRPTDRHLAWYFPLADWDGGNIANNLLVRQNHPDIDNAYGIQMEAAERNRDQATGEPITQGRGSLQGKTRNVNIFRNVVHGVRMSERNAPLKLLAHDDGGFKNVRVYDNQFQSQAYPNTLAVVETLDGVTFENNTWYSVTEDKPFRLGRGDSRRTLSFEEWIEASGERGAAYRKIDYPDSGRSIENYMRKLGYEGTDDELYARFFAEARTMRRGAWRRAFTAHEINDYFREGFGVDYLPREELPAVQCGPFRPEFSYRKYVSEE